MGAYFEKVSRFANTDIPIPVRATANSAGYDLAAAESIDIPPLSRMYDVKMGKDWIEDLESVERWTKSMNFRPTLVSTGLKCHLDPGTYLELSARSSTPLKYLLILANGVGVIDADYYNNPNNEGEIFLQFINLSPITIHIEKGDKLGQGIIKPYLVVENDNATGERQGGFGSTSK